MYNSKTRVVVTGLGVISSIGSGKEKFWQAAIAGKSGVGIIESFNTTKHALKRGCEVKDFHPDEKTISREMPYWGRSTQFAVAAVKLSFDDAALSAEYVKRSRIGISLGTTAGEIQQVEKLCRFSHGGIREENIDKRIFSQVSCKVITANVARCFDIQGPHMIFANACAAGNYAIGYAYDLIKQRKADVMIAGGVDSFSEAAFTGFCRMKVVSPDVCRPFDKNRKGLILGEGSGMLILESIESARSRQAHIYAEISGCGFSCDGFHVTSPDPTGKGMASAMEKALAEACLTPDDINYICAHGTGTIVNDKTETLAVKKLFGDHAPKLLMSSIKGMIGHTMGAASAIGSVICSLVVDRNIVPPTINFETKDPDCDLDYVPNIRRERRMDIVMNNAFAFGGENTSVIFRKYEE